MALTIKPLLVPFLVPSFHYNMFVVIGWEDYVIRRSLMMMILLLYHITINVLKSFQTIYLTLSFWPRFLWHLFGPSSKGQSIYNILFNTYAPPRSLQKDDLWSIHASRRLTCHHYDHQLTSVIQVRGDSKHQAQPMNQSFVAAINAATSYKPLVDPLRLAKLYNYIQSGLTLPPDCLLSRMLACISIIMVFTTIIVTRSVQYRLSVPRVTTKNSPEKPTGKPTKTNFYRTRRKVRQKKKNLYNSTLPTMQITMLTTSTDKIQSPNSFSVDTDGVYFIIDNSANGGICNIKSMFVGDFENQKVTLITAEGKTTTIKKVGTICLVLKDDAGINWSYDIPDVVYDPESPYSLLGIPFLGRYFAKNDEANEFDNDTWIRSASTNSLFQWDHGKHQRHFAHGSCHLPELLTNEGETYFTAFCT